MKKVFNKSTELCVDLKTILRSDRITEIGKSYQGVLTCDNDEQFTFVETLPWTTKRNPCLFRGKYISITQQDNGTLRLNFKPLPEIGKKISVEYFAFEVYREVRQGLNGLVGKK